MIILGEKNGKIEIFCSKCGAVAKFSCENCGKPLCGRCRTRKKKDIILNTVIPSGLCDNCVEERQREFKLGKLNILTETVIHYAEPIISEPKKNQI